MPFKGKGIVPADRDFLVEDLPQTRKKQFFVFFKEEWRLLLRLAFLFLLLFAPYLGISAFEGYYLAYNEGADALAFSLINESVKAVCLILPFLGFGGLCQVHRRMCLGEGVMFWKDFFSGFSLRWASFGFLIGLGHVGMVYLSSLSSAFAYAGVFYFVLLGILDLAVLPILGFSYSQLPYYDLTKSGGYMRNGVKFVIKYYPWILLFSIFPLGLDTLHFIPNLPLALYDALLALFSMLSPIYCLAFFSFALDKFDKHLNQTAYPSLYRKGLSKEAKNKDIEILDKE